MTEETAYWFLSALVQCIATLLGFLIVGLFYYLESINRSLENLKLEIKNNDVISAFDTYIFKLFDILLKQNFAKGFSSHNLLRLTILLIMTSFFLLFYRNDVAVYMIFISFIVALGWLIYETDQIINDFEDTISWVKKGERWKKIQQDLRNSVYKAIQPEIRKIIEKEFKKKLKEIINQKLEEKWQISYR